MRLNWLRSITAKWILTNPNEAYLSLISVDWILSNDDTYYPDDYELNQANLILTKPKEA